MRKLMLLVFLSLSPVCGFALQDVTVEWHVHTAKLLGGFSDGGESPEMVLLTSACQVVVFSDHLDGISAKAKKGISYLDTIRGISGKHNTLAIPAVEVTAGYDYSAYDVIALGITEDSLTELIDLYDKGAFHDPETGLPALEKTADKYNLVLVAAHPDNEDTLVTKGIPFDLKHNARYVNGFEMFDSKHIGLSADRFFDHCSALYGCTDRFIVTAGSDFHYLIHGQVPTKSFREAPITHIILDEDAELAEETVTEAIRKGRVYATSLKGVGIAQSNVLPGGLWLQSEQLCVECRGLYEDNLLYDKIYVTARTSEKVGAYAFKPLFEDGRMILRINPSQLPKGTRSLNIDFGGRLLTSTIFTDVLPAIDGDKLPDLGGVGTSGVLGPGMPGASGPSAQGAVALGPGPLPGEDVPQGMAPAAMSGSSSGSAPGANLSTVNTDPFYGVDMSIYKYRYRGGSTESLRLGKIEYVILVDYNLNARVWFKINKDFPPIVFRCRLKVENGYATCRMPFSYDHTQMARIPYRYTEVTKSVRVFTPNKPGGSNRPGEFFFGATLDSPENLATCGFSNLAYYIEGEIYNMDLEGAGNYCDYPCISNNIQSF